MNKIKLLFAGALFVAQGVNATPTPTMTLSSASGGCARSDFFIISIVSTGVILLEKVCEKIYRYCMARNSMENTSEIELGSSIDDQNDKTTKKDNKKSDINQELRQELL